MDQPSLEAYALEVSQDLLANDHTHNSAAWNSNQDNNATTSAETKTGDTQDEVTDQRRDSAYPGGEEDTPDSCSNKRQGKIPASTTVPDRPRLDSPTIPYTLYTPAAPPPPPSAATPDSSNLLFSTLKPQQTLPTTNTAHETPPQHIITYTFPSPCEPPRYYIPFQTPQPASTSIIPRLSSISTTTENSNKPRQRRIVRGARIIVPERWQKNDMLLEYVDDFGTTKMLRRVDKADMQGTPTTCMLGVWEGGGGGGNRGRREESEEDEEEGSRMQQDSPRPRNNNNNNAAEEPFYTTTPTPQVENRNNNNNSDATINSDIAFPHRHRHRHRRHHSLAQTLDHDLTPPASLLVLPQTHPPSQSPSRASRILLLPSHILPPLSRLLTSLLAPLTSLKTALQTTYNNYHARRGSLGSHSGPVAQALRQNVLRAGERGCDWESGRCVARWGEEWGAGSGRGRGAVKKGWFGRLRIGGWRRER
ncbi:unnamed protein product [Periconia digitata]|uniref:Uncharacterized protein n=1 Tax=Periconia digitata TaxID=1303443 RepID=A0A9W4U3J7_9PLEO|nr:unnamed protein product [Periconia digitata]